MKRNRSIFFRSFYISLTIMACLLIATVGTAKAYEATVQTAFGEYKKALELNDGTLRIFDFEIRLKKSS